MRTICSAIKNPQAVGTARAKSGTEFASAGAEGGAPALASVLRSVQGDRALDSGLLTGSSSFQFRWNLTHFLRYRLRLSVAVHSRAQQFFLVPQIIASAWNIVLLDVFLEHRGAERPSPEFVREEVLFVLRKAAEEAHLTAGQTRALICETRSLLRKAERLKMRLIESR